MILADGAYGDNTRFRQGLSDRGHSWVLDVKHTTSAYPEAVKPEQPEYQGRGQPPKRRYRQDPSSLLDLALAAGADAAEEVSWREGTRGEMTSRFLALRVRPANIELRRAANKGRPRARRRMADLRVAHRQEPAGEVLALELARRERHQGPHQARQVALANRARLPRAQRRTRAGPLRGPLLARIQPSRHARQRRAHIPNPATTAG